VIEVELDVFSGRPNPRWTLDPLSSVELSRLLSGRSGDAAPERLGYRGFLVHLTDDDSDTVRVYGEPALERWLLETGRAHLAPELAAHVLAQLVG
jgi:hypothetical protein